MGYADPLYRSAVFHVSQRVPASGMSVHTVITDVKNKARVQTEAGSAGRRVPPRPPRDRPRALPNGRADGAAAGTIVLWASDSKRATNISAAPSVSRRILGRRIRDKGNMEDASSPETARRFVRSLNILLKTVRLYGTEHERTTTLLGVAWEDLRKALQSAGKTGLLLGVTGTQVLLDGAPLEKRPTDRSFALLLSSAGLSSIHFSPQVTADDFWRLVRGFATRAPQAGSHAADLRAALGGDKGPIRVNEVRFVAQDASLGGPGMAAELAARSLGADAKKLQPWLENPQRLLQLIAAAEGARSQPTGPSASAGEAAVAPPQGQEDDVLKVLQCLSQLGQTSQQPESARQIGAVEQHIQQLPVPGQAALTQALLSLESQSEPPRPDAPLLLQIAERVAIRFALEQYQRGDVRTNAVVELLDRLKREIGSLREVLKVHEEKMGRAGLEVESHSDILDRQFWAGVPERAKRKILLSPEAWAIPPRNIRQFVGELFTGGDVESARDILENYAQCVHTKEGEARRKAATGLTDLADLYSRVDVSMLKSTLHHLGEELGRETNADLQSLLDATFVRHSHEAAARRQYPAIQEALVAMETLERCQPGHARILWPRVRVGNPLPVFIEEALHAPRIPDDLVEVLRRMPQAAVDQMASRIPHFSRRDEWERLLELAHGVGPEAVVYLRKILQNRPAPEATSKVALLSRLEPSALEELLPSRLRDWDQIAHDQVVRQLASSLAPQRGRLLEKIFDLLSSNVWAEAVDEIGMCGDSASASRLRRIVENESSHPGEPYLQIKAIEALGRLRESSAESLLRPFAEAKRFWRWRYPRELRITALQALQKIDPEWAKHFLPRSGLNTAEMFLAPLDPEPDTPWLRQRRYLRMNLPYPLKGEVHSARGSYRIAIEQLSLGGGVARSQCHIKPGVVVGLEFPSGLHRIHTDVLVREAHPQELTFELVRIGLEDRNRLRRPLAGLQARAN